LGDDEKVIDFAETTSECKVGRSFLLFNLRSEGDDVGRGAKPLTLTLTNFFN
jgi:hypothetical protein